MSCAKPFTNTEQVVVLFIDRKVVVNIYRARKICMILCKAKNTCSREVVNCEIV